MQNHDTKEKEVTKEEGVKGGILVTKPRSSTTCALEGDIKLYAPSFGHLKLWQSRYLMLAGSTLWIYKKPNEQKPIGEWQLGKGVAIVKDPDIKSVKKKPHMFVLVNLDTRKTLIMRASSDQKKQEWLDSFLVALNSGRSPTLPPVKSKTKDYTAKMLESAVNSDVIRKIAKEILNKDSMAIFETLKTFMSKVEKDEKKLKNLKNLLSFSLPELDY